MKNIAYAGALVALLDIDMDVIDELLDEKFAQEEGAARLEPQGAARWATTTRKEHLDCPLPFRLEKMDATDDTHPDRRQHRDRARLRLRGRDGGRLVPDHAVDVGDGRVQGVLRAVPQGSGDRQEQLLHPAGRGRAGGDRHGDRRGWNGARAFTSTSGPGISLMSELIGLAYYAEIPAVIVDVQRTGPVDGHADAHAAGRHPDVRLRVARRHQAHPAVPGEPGGVLHFAVEGLRSGRALPDAGVHAVRPRHRHERLGLPALQVGRQLPARPRPRARRRASSRRWPSSTATRRRERRPRRGAHAARRALEGRVLHARLGPQQVRRLHRDPRRVPGGRWTACCASTRRPRKLVPAPDHPQRRRARPSASSPSAAATRRCARRSTMLGEQRHRRRLHAHPRLPVRRQRRGVPRRARAHLRRRAEPRRAAAIAADRSRPASPRSKLHSMLVYGGFPLSARSTSSTAITQPAGARAEPCPRSRNRRRSPQPAPQQARA